MPINDPSPEERKRIVRDALSKMSKSLGLNGKAPSQQEQTIAKARSTSAEVVAIGRSVLKADPSHYDKDAMMHLLHKLFTEKFSTWDKDELIFLLAVTHVEVCIDSVENSI